MESRGGGPRITRAAANRVCQDQHMNRLRAMFNLGKAGQDDGPAAAGPPADTRQAGFDPALEALFERANEIRADNGLQETADSTIAAQMVLTSIAMDVLQVADRQLHPDLLDAEDAGLAWAYVCLMGMRIIAIVDRQDDFDNQAFILAVACAVFQFYGDEAAVRIVHAGTGLFQQIVTANRQSAEFIELNDQVHKLILASIGTGSQDAIVGLRARFAAFAEFAA